MILKASLTDFEILNKLDEHIAREELRLSIINERIYVYKKNGSIIGWLRYNLFWDNTPFMNMLYVLAEYRGKGYGKALVKGFEEDMLKAKYFKVMTSTLECEDAKDFYYHLGYEKVGGFYPTKEEYELILMKNLV